MRKIRIWILGLLVLLLAAPFFSASIAKAGEIRAAGVYTTPLEEPFINNIHQAFLRAEKEMGITYDHTEKVGPADFERVLREYASRGYRMICVDASGHEEMARRVAKDFPDVAFLATCDLGPVAPNFYASGMQTHEATYLAGIVAGSLTKTNVIGIVAAYPVPMTNRHLNGFILGVKEINPKAKILLTYISSWFDPPKAKEASMAQIESKADVLYAERYGVIEACQKKGVLAIGQIADQNSLAPETVVTSSMWYPWPSIQKVLLDVKENRIGRPDTALDLRQWNMILKDGCGLAPFHGFEDKLPKKLKSAITDRIQKIKSGMLIIPINSGTPKLD